MPSKHQGLPLRVGHPTFVRFVAKLADLRVLRLRAQLECQAERAIRSHNPNTQLINVSTPDRAASGLIQSYWSESPIDFKSHGIKATLREGRCRPQLGRGVLHEEITRVGRQPRRGGRIVASSLCFRSLYVDNSAAQRTVLRHDPNCVYRARNHDVHCDR